MVNQSSLQSKPKDMEHFSELAQGQVAAAAHPLRDFGGRDIELMSQVLLAQASMLHRFS